MPLGMVQLSQALKARSHLSDTSATEKTSIISLTALFTGSFTSLWK